VKARKTPLKGVAEFPLPAGARCGGDLELSPPLDAPRAVFYAATLDTTVSLRVAAAAPTECCHAANPARPQPLSSRNGDGGILAKAERCTLLRRCLEMGKEA